MKTLSKKALGLLLILTTQVFAQRFFAAEPDIIEVGFSNSNVDSGYNPAYKQTAALGEKNSIYADFMLLSGRDSVLGSLEVGSYKVVDSHGNEFGNIYPMPLSIISSNYAFVSSSGKTIYDTHAGAVIVLDSFSDNKKAATVLFATLRRLVIMELKINSSNSVEYSTLKSLEMPSGVGGEGSPTNYMRLALLGVKLAGNDKVYNIAIGNPFHNDGQNLNAGRVDFLSIRENSWTISRPNTKGIVAGDVFVFNQNTAFGTDLVSVGDLDGNGYNDLAVLLPASAQFPDGAVYVFFMKDEYTPDLENPVIIAGNSMPWKEDVYKNHTQNCHGMSFVSWKNESHLLLSCNVSITENSTYRHIVSIKDIVLDSSGNIANTSIFSAEEISGSERIVPAFSTNSNPVPIINNNSLAVVLPISGPCSYCSKGSLYVYRVIDADASKNFSIDAGERETIISIDSLFYKSGMSGYSAKTLAGIAKCFISASGLICEAVEKARGSWSMVELSAGGSCNAYRACKERDTVYIYTRTNSDALNMALRVPKDVVMEMQGGSYAFEDINSLAYFKNPSNLSTDISWDSDGLKLSVFNNFKITSLNQSEGVDTLVFSTIIGDLTKRYPVYFHIADTSKILNGIVPATPANDTVWNTAKNRYIALPGSSSNGNIYTYDIAQDSLKNYAEILGNYLHILDVDVAEVFVAYTENSEVKYRKIVLMPEAKPLPPDPEPTPVLQGVFAHGSARVVYSRGGIQINGVYGDLDMRVYNFKGVEIQREKIRSQGSDFVKLKQKCPQIVQIKTANEKIYLRVVN